ncbi:MAG: hypothetical protein M3O30_07495 [Planctomycetota bacterium]|nr:hypothetical protein [Planctomycetota bacterium]
MTHDSSTPAGSNELPSTDNPTPPGNAGGLGSPAAAPQAPKRRRRWGRLILGIVAIVIVLLALLVLLAPTLVSTGVARSLVVDRINASYLNGKLEIKDWSFGWTGGIRIEGIQLTDTNNVVIAQIGKITSPISLLHTLSGKIDLGDVQVDGLNVNAIQDKDGNLNLAKVVKPLPPSTGPLKLPDITGVLHINDSQGSTLQDVATGLSIILDHLNATVTVKDINQPIHDTVEIVTRVNNQPPGTIKLDGDLSAIQNNIVDAQHASGNQSIELSQVDLKPVSVLLAKQKMDLQIAGILNGKIKAQLKSLDDMDASGSMTIADSSVSGGQLHGDTVAYKQVRIDLAASSKQNAVKVSLPIVATSTAATRPDQITVNIDAPRDALLQTQQLMMGAVEKLMSPGSAATSVAIANAANGTASVQIDVDAANLAHELHNTVHLQPGMTLSSGRTVLALNLNIAGGGATLDSQAHLNNFNGTQNGAAIKLADIDANINAVVAGGAATGLTSLTATVNSAFMKINGSAQGLAKTDFTAALDLKSLQQQLAQFFDLNAMLHAPANSSVAIAGATTAHLTSNGNAFALDAAVNQLSFSGIQGVQMSPQDITLNLRGELQRAADSSLQSIHHVTVALQSPAAVLNATADLDKKPTGWQAPAFEILGTSIDARKALDNYSGLLALLAGAPKAGEAPTLLQKLADRSLRVASGTISISGRGKFDDNGLAIDQPLTAQLSAFDLSVPTAIGGSEPSRTPPVTIAAASGTDQTINIHALVGTAADSIATADVSIINPLAKNAGGALSLNVTQFRADFAKLQAAFGPLAPTLMPGSGGEAFNRVTVKSGVASGSAKYSHSASGDVVSSNVQIQQLTIPGVVDNQAIQLTADATLNPDYSGGTLSNFNLDFGFAKIGQLKAEKPIQFSGTKDLATMSVDAGVVITGDAAKVMRFVELATGKPVNTYNYSGQIALSESLQKDAKQAQLTVKGGGAITSFKVLGAAGAAPAFAEDEVDIGNDLIFNVKAMRVVIRPEDPVRVVMKSSGALSLAISGAVSDLMAQRKIDAGTIQLTYDLAKLWTIIKPLLTPAQQQQYADLVITGTQQRTFSVSGMLPADKPFMQGLATLKAAGAFQIDSVSTHGIQVTGFELPFVLADGTLRTVYANQPEGKNAPRPAACNGGTLDLGILSVDLRGPVMLLSMPGVDPQHPHQLLNSVSLNPALASTLLEKFLNNPAFAGSSNSRGLVDLSVLQCQALPLDSSVLQATPDNKGVAEVVCSTREMQMGSSFLSQLQLIQGNQAVSMDIQKADVKIADGKLSQDTTMMVDGNKPMHFYGNVLLSTRQFENMNLDISTLLLGKLVTSDQNLKQYIPDQISLPVTGTMSSPQVNVSGVAGRLLKDAATKAGTSALGNLLGGNRNQAASRPADPNQPAQPAGQPDPLQQLFQNLTKPKK